MKAKTIQMSDFFCTQCGGRGIPVWRKQSKAREAGHLKKLYCLNCGEETNHIEIRPFGGYTYEDFLVERNYGNFNADGTRKMSYGELRSKIHNGKINPLEETDSDVRDSGFGKINLDTSEEE